MTPKGDRRRVAAILVSALLVIGTGVAVTGTTGTETPSVDTAMQETTTTEADQQSNVSIRNLTAPEQVRVGSNYTVSATIVNRGDEQITNRFSYQIAGNAIAVEFVNVSANETETVRFNVTGNDTAGFPTGTFTHGVYTEGANATANLTLVGETTPTPSGTTTTTTDTTTTPETTTPETTPTTTPETTTTTTTEATTTPTETTTTPTETITTTPEATPTETTSAETTPAEAPTASIVFEDQDSNGSTVTVQSVTVPEGGFVVIHDNGIVEGEVVDSVLGQSTYLEAGTHENVTIELNRTLNQSQRVFAVVYRDSNDNQEFDFVTSNRRVDGPYTKPDSREAVNGIAVIEVNEGTTNESA